MRHYMIPATMNPACRGRTPTPGKAADVALAQPDGAAQAVELPLDAADRRRRGAQPPRESCAPSAGAGAPCAPGPWGGRPMRAPGFRPPEPSGGFCRGRASRASVVGPHETVQAGICEPRGLTCLFTKTCARIKACACPQCAVARLSGSMTCSNFTALRMIAGVVEGWEETALNGAGAVVSQLHLNLRNVSFLELLPYSYAVLIIRIRQFRTRPARLLAACIE